MNLSKMRTGVGVDAHQFGESGPCSLAGLQWPEAPRLVGHSDGASGIAMLEKLRDFVTAKGFVINNVSLQIVGNQPKITPRRDEAQNVLSTALGAPVSVAATTSDQMGFTGRGEGIYVIANALVIAP